MHPRAKEILIDLAERAVREGEEWHLVFGNHKRVADADKASVMDYQEHCKENEAVRNAVLPELIALGHTVYTAMITGCAPSTVGNYEVEEKVVEKFGDRVLPDSEHSQLWIMTTEADKDEVLAFIRETAGEGEIRYYSGDTEPSYFEAYIAESPHIVGLGSWRAAAKLLEELR